jgi:uncharacterized protein with von Willebrand factor type A (vWA) domain
MKGEAWCYVHHPDLTDERRAASRKGGYRGGRGRPLAELGDVKRKLRELADDVMSGQADRANAAVAGQLLGTFLRAVSVEMKVREQDEILQRIDALESAARKAGEAGSGARGRT